MTDLQIRYHTLKEQERANQEQEAIKRTANKIAQQQADTAGRRADIEQQRVKSQVAEVVRKYLGDFTLTPSSQGTFFKEVGQGFGSSAQGAAAIAKMVG